MIRHIVGLAILVCTSLASAEPAECLPIAAALATFENDPHDDLHAAVIVREGELIAEKYFNDGALNTLVDVRSAGKSVMSLVFGIALDQNAIISLNDPVAKYWPASQGRPIGSVQLANLLTMQSGLDADANDPSSPGYEDNMDASDNPPAVVLSVPGKEEQGTRYRYNSLAAYVAGVVVEQATGVPLETFAQTHLFEPLGMQKWDWMEDRAGQTKGQGNLFLTARDFARIGQMVLSGGIYDGKQIVSSTWIQESLKRQVDVSKHEPNAIGYGYYWFYQEYTINGQSVGVSFASGNGGNKIYLIPKLDLVVAVMSRAYGQGRGHRRSEDILKAVLAAQFCGEQRTQPTPS